METSISYKRQIKKDNDVISKTQKNSNHKTSGLTINQAVLMIVIVIATQYRQILTLSVFAPGADGNKVATEA